MPDEASPEDVEGRFDEALQEVIDSFDHLKKCAAARDSNMVKATTTAEAGSLESLLPDNLPSPCGGAPLYNEETFFGRQNVLDKMNHALAPGENKKENFCTISGLGGVGKSKVALAYAKRYGSQFSIILWIKCQDKISLGRSFTDIAMDLRIPDADRNKSGDENRELVYDWLKKYCEQFVSFPLHYCV